ncbi:dynein intermediate chain [Trichosporon asahii var. asahii CBS 8904]|uniref:Dynein intermediate chain n=1 Tax=Trichosporon asahii var. asahii (strain CBS 8904) TaxID=1220162 RepID=K1V9W1_TRIAC|nr:dynein intermediate chain [Trichosporon asahii var. asahii CBS 8904]
MGERRKQEIEEKKARLAELRRARAERQKLLAQAEAGPSDSPALGLTTRKAEVNDLVDQLLASNRPGSPYTPGAPSRASLSALQSNAGTPPASVPSTPSRSGARPSEGGLGSRPISMTIGPDAPPTTSVAVQVEYVDTYTEMWDMPSKAAKPETYSKSVQTNMVSTGTETSDDEEEFDNRRNVPNRETEDELRARIIAELDDERKQLEKELKELKEKTDSLQLQQLPDEQRQAIFATPDFTSFLEGSSRIVQRALSDGYDYIKDYTIGVDGGFEGQKVKLFCAFSDDRWTNGRSVTDLDWSPKSDILSVTFSPFHPTLIFGGSYSGQVLLWDTRAKHLPVLKTPLSASGHTYPIYAMKVVGTQNANSLITTSTDGLVCSWQADMLSQPQEALLLTVPSPTNKTDEVSITCMDFEENETATFWVGTEEGSVYQANRYDRASAKAGLNPDDVYRGHAGPVTGIDFHPSSGSIDLLRPLRHLGGKPAHGGERPVHSFESADDYVFDVKWHPQHPALFGSVDGSGKFDLWNLNQDVEVPSVSTQVSSQALNKIAWDRSPSSRKVGLGGSDGKLYVYDVSEKVVQPRENEWVELQKTVQNLVASRDAGGGLGSVPLPEPTARYRV